MADKIMYKDKKLSLKDGTDCILYVDDEPKNVQFAYKQGNNYFFTGLVDVGLIGAQLINGKFIYVKGLKVV